VRFYNYKNINAIEGWIRASGKVEGKRLYVQQDTDEGLAGSCVDSLSAIGGAAIGAALPAISAAMTRPVNVLRYE
jgi:hypothetical protein